MNTCNKQSDSPAPNNSNYSSEAAGYYNTKKSKPMRTKRYELVELIVPANTTTKAMFKELPNLRTQQNNKVQVQAIEAFSIKEITVSPTGTAMCAVADFAKAYLVLNVSGEERVFQIPLVQLRRITPDNAAWAASVRDLAQFDSLESVDWTKSYVLFGSAPAATAFSILFGVHYTRM